MGKKIHSLPIQFFVNYETSDKDNRFISISIDVLHTGLNLNGSVFEKSVVDENIDSIKNTPILGFIHELPDGENDFKGHEYIITKVGDDGLQRKYVGSAYGVIPESCNPRWIMKMCDDGVEREFLQVDGLVWSKFEDASDILLRDIEKPQSMELYPDNIEGYEDEDGYFHFEKFSFNGCCILGSDVEPAMVDSKVEVQFTMNDFVKNVQSELNDKYCAFMKCKKEINEGGSVTMPKDNKDYSISVNQQIESISNMVSSHETFTDKWGWETSRYCYVDIQDNEVIVMDKKQNWQYYGFTFSMNNDEPVIDFENCVRKKITFENFDDGSTTASTFDFGAEVEAIGDKMFEKIEDANKAVEAAQTAQKQAEENYSTIKADYDDIKPKFDEYVKKEQEQEAAKIDAEKDAQFARFERVLGDNADFVELKNNKDSLSVKDIEDKCSVLYARINLENFSRSNNKDMSIGIVDDDTDNSSKYVENSRYGRIPVNN